MKSENHVEEKNRKLYMLRRYQLNMAEISKITLMPDEQTCVCHNPECGAVAHIDHALAPNKDQKAHWIVCDDTDHHFCSPECYESTWGDALPFSSTVCPCDHCTEIHDMLALELYSVPHGGTIHHDKLGECIVDGKDCIVCERRGTTAIPHVRCAHVGHRPLTVFDKTCWQCDFDASIADIRFRR